MSRYSGKQGAGAARRVREQKRREAEARNALYQYELIGTEAEIDDKMAAGEPVVVIGKAVSVSVA